MSSVAGVRDAGRGRILYLWYVTSVGNEREMIQEVIERWEEQGIVRPAAAAWQIDELAARRAVVLPEAFRQLWLASDGTASMDDDEIIFWPLDNISDDPALEPATTERESRLVFADWRLTGAVFYIEFAGAAAGAVVRERARDRSRVVVADGFASFLERYLDDPSELVPKR